MPQRSARPYSLARPLPPWVWIAASSACRPASAAAYLAMFAASPAATRSSAWSCIHAALAVMSRASSTSILATASGCAMPWWRPIGVPQTSRSLA